VGEFRPDSSPGKRDLEGGGESDVRETVTGD
jgi:hypothetical protein